MNKICRRKFLINSTFAISGLSGDIINLRNAKLFGFNFNELYEKETVEISANLANISSKHPSLHFDSEGLKQLRINSKGTHRKYAEILFNWVTRNQSFSPMEMLNQYKGNEVSLEQCGAFLTNTALAFVVSEKDEYLNISRKWALEMCEYPLEKVLNYGFGIYAAGLARAYDWLYHYVKEQERDKIRDYLIYSVEKLYKGSIPNSETEHWWAKNPMHHDHWIPVGGYGEASLALLGEVKDASNWAVGAKIDFDIAFSWLGDDGAWHEGAADWCYALAPLLWFYSAWQSVVGENLHNNLWLKNTSLYRIYHWLPDDSYVYLDDSFRSGRYNTSGSASCHLLRRLASIFQDGYTQWLAERDEAFDLKIGPKGVFQAPYENLSFSGSPREYPHTDSQCVAWNLLWYDPTVKSVPPSELPHSHHFKNQDIVIIRTGWDKDSAIVSFSCSPLAGQKAAERIRSGEQISTSNYSHSHADYSSFTLFARGQYFIVPPGYARRSSGFQNVVSINGSDFLIDPSIDVRIISFHSEKEFTYAVGDATKAFNNQLGIQKYRRHILMLEPDWLVIFDDLRLNEIGRRGRTYNRFIWTVHSDPNTHKLSIIKNKAIWESQLDKEPKLTMEILEPNDFAWEHSLIQSNNGKNMLEALRLIRPELYSSGIQVLSVWSWQDTPEMPQLLRDSEFLALLWNKASKLPSIGFSISNNIPSNLSYPDLKGRELLLFGQDPNHPDYYLRVKDGKI